MFRRVILSGSFLLANAIALPSALAQPAPPASGRVIEAADGDVVIVPHGARVAVVRRAQVQARLVYVAAQQTLLLLTDPATFGPLDLADAKGFRRWHVQGSWPLESRWEGNATLDEYVPLARSALTLAIHTDRGTILVANATGQEVPYAPAPLAVVRTTLSSGRPVRGSFDEIEQAWLANGDIGLSALGPVPLVGAQVRMGPSASRSAVAPSTTGAASAGALRVGGSIAVPKRIQNADPVYPELAKNAGVQGVVILEVTVGEDGAVSDARVLRSIPLLDTAALDAVKQWRYEPTLLNGVARPVIMTVTVNFTLPPRARF